MMRMADKMSAHRVFFPLAALFAALAVPIWSVAYQWSDAPTGVTVLWHGHEMVFGFALAVIAGFLLTRISIKMLILLVALWLVARAAALQSDLPWPALVVLQLAYPFALAVVAAEPFARAAKSWRNLMFVPVLAGFSVAEMLFHMGNAGVIPGGGMRGLVLGVDLIACLMFMMGGRITAAATSGAIQKLGEKLLSPAQAGLERNGLIALILMSASQVVGIPVLPSIGAAAAATIVALRLYRWKGWKVADRPEVICLHLGFLWLGLGLFVRAGAGILGPHLLPTALHGVTIGALGTFSLVIMTRTTSMRARTPIRVPKTIIAALFLIAVAVMARFAAYLAPEPGALILVSATLWSTAFLLYLLKARHVL